MQWYDMTSDAAHPSQPASITRTGRRRGDRRRRRTGRAVRRAATGRTADTRDGCRSRGRNRARPARLDVPSADARHAGAARHHRRAAGARPAMPALADPPASFRRPGGVRPFGARWRDPPPLPPAMRAMEAIGGAARKAPAIAACRRCVSRARSKRRWRPAITSRSRRKRTASARHCAPATSSAPTARAARCAALMGLPCPKGSDLSRDHAARHHAVPVRRAPRRHLQRLLLLEGERQFQPAKGPGPLAGVDLSGRKHPDRRPDLRRKRSTPACRSSYRATSPTTSRSNDPTACTCGWCRPIAKAACCWPAMLRISTHRPAGWASTAASTMRSSSPPH